MGDIDIIQCHNHNFHSRHMQNRLLSNGNPSVCLRRQLPLHRGAKGGGFYACRVVLTRMLAATATPQSALADSSPYTGEPRTWTLLMLLFFTGVPRAWLLHLLCCYSHTAANYHTANTQQAQKANLKFISHYARAYILVLCLMSLSYVICLMSYVISSLLLGLICFFSVLFGLFCFFISVNLHSAML